MMRVQEMDELKAYAAANIRFIRGKSSSMDSAGATVGCARRMRIRSKTTVAVMSPEMVDWRLQEEEKAYVAKLVSDYQSAEIAGAWRGLPQPRKKVVRSHSSMRALRDWDVAVNAGYFFWFRRCSHRSCSQPP